MNEYLANSTASSLPPRADQRVYLILIRFLLVLRISRPFSVQLRAYRPSAIADCTIVPVRMADVEEGLDSLSLERQNSALLSPQRHGGKRAHRQEPFFIGVAGGTASGKTTACDMVCYCPLPLCSSACSNSRPPLACM